MSVRCGHCSTKGIPVDHDTVAQVRLCAERAKRSPLAAVAKSVVKAQVQAQTAQQPVVTADQLDHLRVREGESIREYIHRMHAVDTGARDASRRRQRRTGECNCPTAYARCKWARLWDEQAEDFTSGHGGWGWSTYDWNGNGPANVLARQWAEAEVKAGRRTWA